MYLNRSLFITIDIAISEKQKENTMQIKIKFLPCRTLMHEFMFTSRIISGASRSPCDYLTRGNLEKSKRIFFDLLVINKQHKYTYLL